jgi:L-histidine Nalpha-methyltransferase
MSLKCRGIWFPRYVDHVSVWEIPAHVPIMDQILSRLDMDERFRCMRVPAARPVPGLEEDVRRGLLVRPRSLPPKYFYDERGSALFDRICDTPEYYPTRTEDALLAACAGQVIARARPDHIIELGSGASRKTGHLLTALDRAGLDGCQYWPFDVCEPMLRQAAARLMAAHAGLRVNALVGDYLGGLSGMPRPGGRRLFVFLGSTIGNFEPAEAVGFLRELAALMDSGDSLLLGADRVKSPAVLEAAYNDAEGVTAAFNLNLLEVLNRELDSDFMPDAFMHRALYNAVDQRIEMYLISRVRQMVHLSRLGEHLELDAGESILTEISRKFTPETLEAMLGEAGLESVARFEPENGYFSLVHARLSRRSRVRPL